MTDSTQKSGGAERYVILATSVANVVVQRRAEAVVDRDRHRTLVRAGTGGLLRGQRSDRRAGDRDAGLTRAGAARSWSCGAHSSVDAL